MLRSGFDQLIDFREENRLEVWGSVAEEPSRPPGNEEGPGKSPEKGREKSEEKKKRRRRKPERRRQSSEESAEVSSPQVKKKDEKKKNKERSRSARHRRSRKSSSTSSKVKRPSVKEEPSEVERNKGPTEEVVGERPPEKLQKTGEEKSPLTRPSISEGIRLRSAPSSAPSKGRDKSPEVRENPPPGTWTLREKPPEPRYPPRGFRPPEPHGPPPFWRDSGSRGTGRSKGVTRRERQADILQYGPDPTRKAQREERRRG